MSVTRSPKRRVALLMGTSPTYVRELAQGVARYNAEHGRWVVHFERCDPQALPPPWLKTWRGDGILCRVGNRRMARFAAVGLAPGVQPPLDERLDEFVADLGRERLPCAVFTAAGDRIGPQQQQRLARWLRTLPKPLGVLAVNDDSGLRVLNACAQAGLMVPEQVAVIGAGNDDCHLL